VLANVSLDCIDLAHRDLRVVESTFS
jgi:hypothetical protein